MEPLVDSLVFMSAVDIDASTFIQLVIFLSLLVILRGLIFKPFLEVLDERERRTEQTRQEASTLTARAQDLQAKYEAEISAARTRADEAKEMLRRQGVSQREEIVGKARRASAKQVGSVRETVERELDQASHELGQQIDELGRLMSQKLLGRSL